MAGDLLVSEKTDSQTYWYRYDSSGNLVSATIGGLIYFYVKNLQGDIIALADNTGAIVVKYTYDSWGKLLSIAGSLAGTIGVQNPFRYRGYYYDNETGMYYLKNRYYDPELRRFIGIDALAALLVEPENLYNKNLYAYCDNNTIVRCDISGMFWGLSLGMAAIGAGINVISTVLATIITGQDIKAIKKGDIIVAAISGALATGNVVATAVAGGFAGGYAFGSTLRQGGSIADAFLSGVTSTYSTILIGGVGGFSSKPLSDSMNAVVGGVFGFGANLISSATNVGISERNKTSMERKNSVNPAPSTSYLK